MGKHRTIRWDKYWILNEPTKETAEIELAKLEAFAEKVRWTNEELEQRNQKRLYKIELLKKYIWNLS